MKLSIIIVSYNVKYFLAQCLESIYQSTLSHEEFEVFVVDNASPDHTPDYLRQRFPAADYPQLHLICNSRNVGFGRANNQAVKQAKGEYILFLNPDTLLHADTLAQSLAYADAHPDLGGLGTMMLRDNGTFAFESRRGLPTPWVALCKMTGLSSLFPKSKVFGRYYLRYLDETKAAEIEIISGAYFMARQKALQEVGLFDEEFFMYGEDIDLSYRLTLGGYKNHYVPYPMLHYKGESTQKSSFRYVHVFYTAMLIFFKKHFHTYWLGLSLPIKLGILLKAIISLTLQQTKRLQEFLIPVKRYKKHKFVYVGHHTEAIRDLAERWWLDMDYINADEKDFSMPQVPIEAEQNTYTHVVFDTEDFSYSYALDAIRQSNHKAYLGLYHPGENVLVTASRIFSIQA